MDVSKLHYRMLRWAIRYGEKYTYKEYSRCIRRRLKNPVPPQHLEMLRWAIEHNAYSNPINDLYPMYKSLIKNELVMPVARS